MGWGVKRTKLCPVKYPQQHLIVLTSIGGARCPRYIYEEGRKCLSAKCPEEESNLHLSLALFSQLKFGSRSPMPGLLISLVYE
jgi:hypothetical protein